MSAFEWIKKLPPYSGLAFDSRSVKPGDLFFAVSGSKNDGHDHVASALQAGAVIAIGERAPEELSLEGADSSRYLRVANAREALAQVAALFFGHPSRSMRVYGVTGTSGKTTTAYLLESILKAAGLKVGLIGTIESRFESEAEPSLNTTPDPVSLQGRLKRWKEKGCQAAVMEVSSHALDQYRVDGVDFDAGIFTNLSPEHLDYHATMEDYFSAKKAFFERLLARSAESGKRPVAVVNVSGVWGQRLAADLSGSRAFQLATFSTDPSLAADYDVRVTRLAPDGMEGTIRLSPFRSRLIGGFNAENIGAAASALLATGLSVAQVQKGIEALRSVPGRLERVEGPGGEVRVIVDYAHKPDAMEKVLGLLRQVISETTRGRLITVFGCGGDRDASKRPKMGEIANRLSDAVWITSDNPRSESPRSILEQIRAGAPATSSKVVEETDRGRAIEAAIEAARGGDWVAILGKGHEDYQLVPDPERPGELMKIEFDDRKAARDALYKFHK